MQVYAKYKPTGFDCAGLNSHSIGPDDSPDVSSWLVAPCGRNRDSGILQESNWDAQLKGLRKADPDENDFFAADFNHWACGWFEIVLVRPGSPCERAAQEIEDLLLDYPVLDEMDWSDRERKEMERIWSEMSVKERYEMIRDLREKYANRGDRNPAPSIFSARRDWSPENDHIEELLREYANS